MIFHVLQEFLRQGGSNGLAEDAVYVLVVVVVTTVHNARTGGVPVVPTDVLLKMLVVVQVGVSGCQGSVHMFSQAPIVVLHLGSRTPDSWTAERFPRLHGSQCHGFLQRGMSHPCFVGEVACTCCTYGARCAPKLQFQQVEILPDLSGCSLRGAQRICKVS